MKKELILNLNCISSDRNLNCALSRPEVSTLPPNPYELIDGVIRAQNGPVNIAARTCFYISNLGLLYAYSLMPFFFFFSNLPRRKRFFSFNLLFFFFGKALGYHETARYEMRS